ncbi:MAG: WD40 repeat domain-containing protein [Planctomycetes bacterium]|nr:WD40 repeat domain-containing protein [Planctomycetota bacterium]
MAISSAGAVLLILGSALCGELPGTAASAAQPEVEARTDRYGDPLPPHARLRLGRALPHKSIGVHCVDFSPDGKTVASTNGRIVQLWEVITGRRLRQFSGHQEIVTVCAFSPENKFLASLSSNTICLWDVATGKLLREVRDFSSGRGTGIFNYLAWSPDGETLASGGHDKVVRLWDAGTLKEVRQFRGHTGAIGKLIFSGTGGTLLSAGNDRTIRLWDVATGKQIRQFQASPGGDGSMYRALAFSPDGRTLAAKCGRSSFHLLDAGTGEEIRRFGETQQVIGWLAFSPDGSSLVCGSLSNWFSVWDLSTGKQVRQFKGHRGPVGCANFSPDGGMIVSGSWDETFRLWDASTGQLLQQFPGEPGKIQSLAVSSDGRTFATASDRVNHLTVWNAKTGKRLRTVPGVISSSGATLAFSPSERLLGFAGNGSSPLRLWESATGKEHSGFHSGFHPDKDRVFCRFAFSPDGRTLAAADGNGLIDILEIATARKLRELRWYRRTKADEEDGEYPVPLLTFSPDGRTLAVSGMGVLSLWDPTKAKRLRQIPGQWSHVAFSPNGETLATVATDRRRKISTIHLWEPATGNERLQFAGRPGAHVHSIAFSPDSQTLASGCDDAVIRFRSVLTGKEVGRFEGHQGAVTSVAFVPGEQSLVSGSRDCTVLVWDVPVWKQ